MTIELTTFAHVLDTHNIYMPLPWTNNYDDPDIFCPCCIGGAVKQMRDAGKLDRYTACAFTYDQSIERVFDSQSYDTPSLSFAFNEFNGIGPMPADAPKYADISPTEEETIDVAHRIIRICETLGIEYEWDGDAQSMMSIKLDLDCDAYEWAENEFNYDDEYYDDEDYDDEDYDY